MIWSLVEPGVAIIASSLATIRPLLRALKIRGFLSTDKYPSSGISGAARYGRGSRNTRGSMPGQGPTDVSLHSVTKKSEIRPKYVGFTIDESHEEIPTTSQNSGDAPSDARSETFVIEGTENSPTLSTHDLRPVDELADLESHGREYQLKKGWGVQ